MSLGQSSHVHRRSHKAVERVDARAWWRSPRRWTGGRSGVQNRLTDVEIRRTGRVAAWMQPAPESRLPTKARGPPRGAGASVGVDQLPEGREVAAELVVLRRLAPDL